MRNMAARSLLQVTTVVALTAAATSAPAQQLASARDVMSRVAASSPTLTPAHAARVSANMKVAEAFERENRFDDASRIYRSVVDEQAAAGEYPLEALNRIATLNFGMHPYRSAQASMELAAAAAEFGDGSTRLRALFEAALTWQLINRPDKVDASVRQIRPLLKSPAIPEAMRSSIAARLVVRR